MNTIKIRYESSWTNVLSENDPSQLISSSKKLKSVIKNHPEQYVRNPNKALNVIEQVRGWNKLNPEMGYKVPASFDNTIKGVIARITGEVRRLSDLEDDHIAFRAFDAIVNKDSMMQIEDLTNEAITLKTCVNDPSSGRGILDPQNPFLTGSPEARKVLGHYGLPLQDMLTALEQDDLFVQSSNYPGHYSQYITLESLLMEQQKAFFSNDEAQVEKVAQMLQKHLPQYEFDCKKHSLAGVFAIIRYQNLSAQELAALGDYTNGDVPIRGLTGIGSDGKTNATAGRFDAKSFKSGFQPRESLSLKKSTTFPYFVNDLWANRYDEEGNPIVNPKTNQVAKEKIGLGILKKDGYLELHFTDSELFAQLKQKIDNAGVNIFSFGKKGIAYIEEIA